MGISYHDGMTSTSDLRRKLWASREEAGTCIYCGEQDPVPERKGCSECLAAKSAVTVRFNKRNPDVARQYQLRIKHEVIHKYGGYCACCGEQQLLFLTIDHTNNDGYAERKEQGNNSKSFYLKLKREPIRNDLQVLCWNCNFGKVQNNGQCPHQVLNRILKEPIDGRRKSNLNKGTKIVWPEDDELIRMSNESSVSAVARYLGVDPTTVMARLRRRNKYHLVVKSPGKYKEYVEGKQKENQKKISG